MPNVPLAYPPTRRADQTDDYHGTAIADPYRWLEDTDSPETRAWIEAQNALTFAWLGQSPEREQIHRRMTELWDVPRLGAPFKKGARYFQFRNSGLQNQDSLFVMDEPGGEARLLLDPNGLSADGTIAVSAYAASEDGEWLAYALSAGGSDWLTWRVRDTTTGVDLPDVLEWSKFSGAAWRHDASGFYYARYAPPAPGQALAEANYNQRLYFHRLGTQQAEDELVYERPDHKEWGFRAELSDDGRYLILHVWQGTDTRNRVFYQDLPAGGGTVELIPELEAAYDFLGNDGTKFYFRTDRHAPRGRIVAIDIAAPGPAQWQTLVPEGDDRLESVLMAGDTFAAVSLHHAHHRLALFDRSGQLLREVPLPAIGSLLAVHGERGDNELFYQFHSFTVPPTNFRHDLAVGESLPLESPAVAFDFAAYETRQTYATSRDGTRVPMFVVHRKDMALDGSNPTILYGYGGFDISVTPAFAAARLVWLEMGGVFVSANLRGGGEYGEEWHQAGMVHQKQNVFDDFIACAEELVRQGVTTPKRLAIQGRSNGGLLVGACMTQRPELFGAALPGVGVMDMLRFHKFTIGWAWTSDYGSADDAEQFKSLIAYSPLHNLKPGTCYPATLVSTADHDDRVVPGHSFKFAAALQAAQGCDAPVLIRVETKAGHGMGKPTAMIIAEHADNWAFAWSVIGR